MKNYQVAAIFDNIAGLMEIGGENTFKISSYRKAAETFRNLTDSLDDLAEQNELKNIPGVGLAIESKTRQILQTGTCDLFEDLKSKYPPSILDLLALPGVGAKTVQSIYQTLQVASLDELRKAALEGRLKSVPRLSARFEQKILETLERLEQRPAGMPIGRALPATQVLARQLARDSMIAQAYEGGSAIRFADLSPELAVALVGEDPQAALDAALRQFPNCPFETINTYERLVHSDIGDVRLVSEAPDFAGGAIVFATSSIQHWQQLQQIAARNGVLFENFRLTRDGNPIVCPVQESFYRILDIQFVPVELREGCGEVEKAETRSLPRLVEVGDIMGDLHSHTTASDGRETALTMAQAARDRGYHYLAITDHSQALTVARGLTPERLLEQSPVIDDANLLMDGFRILKGIEVDIKSDGSLDLPDSSLQPLDWVVASVHSGFSLSEDEMTARMIQAANSPFVNVIAHPTGRLIGSRDPYKVNIANLVEAAVSANTALEINSSTHRLDLHAENVRLAVDAGAKIVISTDAHRISNLEQMEYGVGVARRAGLTAEDVLNTRSAEGVLDYKRSGS